MTRDEAAAALNGKQYREEGSRELWKDMEASGLVAVFGASDDLMEFRGAIDDEVGCYNGGTAYVTRFGLLSNPCEAGDRCPHWAALKAAATIIRAKWDVDGFSWVYDTQIPHSTFVIKEDDENYCKGIVFALSDVFEGKTK
jgi:hypothetical protein